MDAVSCPRAPPFLLFGGCCPPSFTPLMWCIPLGQGQQSGRQWGGRNVFDKASEVGVNRTGTVPRPPGTLSAPVPWKTSQRDKGLCCPRARWGNPMDTVRWSGDRLPSASGGGFSSGAVLGLDQGGWSHFSGSPGSSPGSSGAWRKQLLFLL